MSPTRLVESVEPTVNSPQFSENNKKILFVCEDNSGPSLMAQVFAEKYGLNAFSAGRHGASALNPYVVKAMKEIGIDISDRKPRLLSPQIISEATDVVTLGCTFMDACPQPMVAKMREKTVDWRWKGLKCKRLVEAVETRDEIERRVIELAERNVILVKAV